MNRFCGYEHTEQTTKKKKNLKKCLDLVFTNSRRATIIDNSEDP